MDFGATRSLEILNDQWDLERLFHKKGQISNLVVNLGYGRNMGGSPRGAADTTQCPSTPVPLLIRPFAANKRARRSLYPGVDPQSALQPALSVLSPRRRPNDCDCVGEKHHHYEARQRHSGVMLLEGQRTWTKPITPQECLKCICHAIGRIP